MKAALLLALLAIVTWPVARAQTGFVDPTRPPSAALTIDTEGNAREAGKSPRLQSVLISPQRRLAVIDGRTVLLGGKVNDATLVQVAETYVTLEQRGVMKTLTLYPSVARKEATPDERGGDKKGKPR